MTKHELTEEDFARDLAIRTAELKEDQLNALELLEGCVVRTKGGIEKIEYLKPTEEKAARQSLARLLRRGIPPLSNELRRALANLFDPEVDGGRRLVFKDQRQPGRTRDHHRNSQIFAFIKKWTEMGGPPQSKVRTSHQVRRRAVVGPAVEAASKKFKLSEEMIWKIYRRYRKLDKLPDENAKVTFYTRVVREA